MEISAETFAAAWPQVVRALAASTGSLDTAEEFAQEAFARAAAQRHPIDSLVGWCIAVGRRAAVDARRRDRVRDRALVHVNDPPQPAPALDDRVALLLVACDPVLTPGAQLVLAMRVVLGVPVERIAAHLGIAPTAASARLTRAKRTLADQRATFVVPAGDERAARYPAALGCVHGMFAIAQRLDVDPADAHSDVARQALSLAAALADDRPGDPEVIGLRATIALGLARRPGRLDDGGTLLAPDLVDRRRWDGELLAAGLADARDCLSAPGRYASEALVAALFSTAPTFWATDWDALRHAHVELERRWPAPSTRLALLVSEAYAALAAHGAGDSGGRLGASPAALCSAERALEPFSAEPGGIGRDARLARADLAWRTRRAVSADRYRELLVVLRDPALGSEPMRRFCAARLAAP